MLGLFVPIFMFNLVTVVASFIVYNVDNVNVMCIYLSALLLFSFLLNVFKLY